MGLVPSLDRCVTFADDDAVLAECELLLRRTLDLMDGHSMCRIVAARLAHLINDVAAERLRQRNATEKTDLPFSDQ